VESKNENGRFGREATQKGKSRGELNEATAFAFGSGGEHNHEHGNVRGFESSECPRVSEMLAQ
jgi:hypothetical protein